MVSETKTIGKYRIDIIQDESPESPRTWDNLGTIVSKKGYGDEHEFNWNDYNSYDEYQKDIERKKNVGVILSVYKYEHGGVVLNTKGFSCPWDSCQIGFIYITKEKIREEYSVKRITKDIIERVTKYLESEIKTYSQYLNGEVYGYRVFKVENGEEEELDSCWGFYGEDECMEEAEGMVRYYIENEKELV